MLKQKLPMEVHYVNGETLDTSLSNAIDTSLGGFDGQAGLGDDYIIGGVGGHNLANGNIIDGEGSDHFIATTATLEKVYDSDDNIIDTNGVIVDLSSSRVTYLGSDSEDIVDNTNIFLAQQLMIYLLVLLGMKRILNSSFCSFRWKG